MQLGAARQRIEPDILVALAVVHGTQAEAALQEEPERTVAAFSSSVTENALPAAHGIEDAAGCRARGRRTR